MPKAISTSGWSENGDIPRFLANGDGPPGLRWRRRVRWRSSGKRGRFGLALRLPTADSLCSLKVARASKISGRKFSAVARRKPTGLDVCRNGCAEMHRGGPYGLPPRRAPFGRKESQPWAGVPPEAVLSPFARRPHRTRLRRHDPQLRSHFRAIAVCPRGGKDRETRCSGSS